MQIPLKPEPMMANSAFLLMLLIARLQLDTSSSRWITHIVTAPQNLNSLNCDLEKMASGGYRDDIRYKQVIVFLFLYSPPDLSYIFISGKEIASRKQI
jgi:hypothetical protein